MSEFDLFRQWRDDRYGYASQQEFSEVDQFEAWQARADIALKRIRELESHLDALRSAVKALPVDELVDMDRYGSPVLLGYVMQAQGEWDAVIKALEPPR